MNYIKSLILLMVIAMASCAPKMAKETASGDNTGSKDFRAMAPKPGPARQIEIGKSTQYTLSNGLKVIVVENHKIPEISYQLTIDMDNMQEKEKAGLSDITGSLLSTGTTTKIKADIDEAVDFIGASMVTNPRGGFASSLTKHTDKILSLFSDVILNPSFPQAEFDKIKTQTLSGLQANKDDPNAISGNVSGALNFGPNHPFGEITNEITVSNVNLDDTKQYYKTYFKPGNAYLVIVGDITPEVAKAKAEKYFGSWPAGKTPVYTYPFPKTVDKTAVAFVDKSGAVQSVINVTYPVDLKPGSPDEIPARVMNTILGSGFSGRLFKNLREDKAYTYGAYSALNSNELAGSFSANASVRNNVTDSAIVQTLIELNRLKDEPVTQKELELAKSFISGAFARSLENPQTVANFALNTLMYGLPADYYQTYLQRLAAVTVDDVARMAKKYINPDKARIVVVGNKDEVYSKLSVFDKEDGKVQLYDIYANPRKDESETPMSITATELVDKYLMALGGRTKLDAVSSLDQTYSMELMGMSITAHMVQSAGKFHMSLTAPGMNLMKQIYDGEKGQMENMGQKSPVEGEDLVSMKEQAVLFPERFFGEAGYKLELKGIEDVNGKPAYKLAVTAPTGAKSTEFFDKETFLKIKEVQSNEVQGQTVTTTNEYGDYKTVDGITIPYTVTISGPMPTPMVMKAETVKVNSNVDPSLFKI
ncbi:MAG: insulinase family protein [Saprospiraceae bacterium]|uniref:Insulinase family protein n=1 Tax=Candidatus Opimibacter skivensis TaxID=2982028 RepID=A0A9D7SRA5_9BACT|nr:insulinase family protein [Candidatus Opimibacter skivensis]